MIVFASLGTSIGVQLLGRPRAVPAEIRSSVRTQPGLEIYRYRHSKGVEKWAPVVIRNLDTPYGHLSNYCHVSRRISHIEFVCIFLAQSCESLAHEQSMKQVIAIVGVSSRTSTSPRNKPSKPSKR